MATTEIKTSILLDGEKAFEAALRNVSREIRVNESEMKALKSAYDLTDDKMGNLQQQSNAVKNSMTAQQAKVEALSRAVKEAAEKYGDGSAEVDGFAISLNRARADLSRMTKESQEMDRQLDELARGADRTGKKLENDLGEGAREASRDIQDMYDSISGKIGDIARTSGISLAMDIGGKVWDFATGLNSFAEESREYRREMSYLQQSAKDAGVDMDFVKTQFMDVASTTGDTSGAVEGLSNLLKVGFDKSELETAIDGLRGAVISFPETMKFETLGEDLRKTFESGEASGQFVDLLEAMGIKVEDFNTAMENSKTVEGDQQIILAALRGELQETAASWDKENQAMKDAETSTIRLNTAWNGLGKTVDIWLTTGRNQLASWLETINGLLTGEKGAADWGEQNLKQLQAWGLPVGDVKPWGESAADEIAGLDDLDAQMQTVGAKAGTSLGEGLAAGLATSSALVIAQVSATVDQINYELSKVNTISLKYSLGGVSGMTGALSGSGVGAAIIELDGRKMGKAILPYVNQGIGSDVKTRETK